MKTLAIYNPKSGSYSKEKLDYSIKVLSEKTGEKITLVESKYPGFGMDFFKKESPELVFIFGGDGFVNEIVKALFLNKIETFIYPIPFGTVNVFCREHKIGKNYYESLQKFGFKRAKNLFVGAFDENIFIQMLGIGFDARAVKKVDMKIKRYTGRYSYFWAGIQSLLSEYNSFWVSLDGLDFNPYHLIVSIGENYGGEFKIAKQKDGYFSVIMAEKGDFFSLLKYLIHIFTFYKNKKNYYTKTVKVSGVNEVQIDGEFYSTKSNKFFIEIVDSKLKLILPEETD